MAAFRDITLRRTAELALRAANGELNRLAGRDALTGLANRRRFEETLEAECRRASRQASPVSLLRLEVDDFAALVDRGGREAGDACLQHVAGMLRLAAGRPADLAARLGGEEFAVLLPGTGEAAVADLVGRLRTDVRALSIARAGRSGRPGFVTASIGAATSRPMPDTLADEPARLMGAAGRVLHGPGRGAGEALAQVRADVAPGSHGITRIAAKLAGVPVAVLVRSEPGGSAAVDAHGWCDAAAPRFWDFAGFDDALPLVVPDARRDPAFRRAWDEAGLAFLAAAPLIGPGHRTVGVLWVADRTTRPGWGGAETALLAGLAGLAAEDFARTDDRPRRVA